MGSPVPNSASELVHVPVPVAPALPADLQVGAASAAVAVRKRMVKQVVSYRELCEVFKAAILDSIRRDNDAIADSTSATHSNYG